MVDLLIVEAFPELRLDELDRASWDEWYTLAIQAEYVLTHLRGIPNVSIDLLLGVPEEILIAERQVVEQELRKVVRMKQFGERHRKKGEKGPVDPEQAALFREEVGRSQMEAMAGDMLGIPQEMMPDVDFSFTEDFLNAALSKGDQQKDGK